MPRVSASGSRAVTFGPSGFAEEGDRRAARGVEVVRGELEPAGLRERWREEDALRRVGARRARRVREQPFARVDQERAVRRVEDERIEVVDEVRAQAALLRLDGLRHVEARRDLERALRDELADDHVVRAGFGVRRDRDVRRHERRARELDVRHRDAFAEVDLRRRVELTAGQADLNVELTPEEAARGRDGVRRRVRGVVVGRVRAGRSRRALLALRTGGPIGAARRHEKSRHRCREKFELHRQTPVSKGKKDVRRGKESGRGDSMRSMRGRGKDDVRGRNTSARPASQVPHLGASGSASRRASVTGTLPMGTRGFA